MQGPVLNPHIEAPQWHSRHHPQCSFRQPTWSLHSKWSFLYLLMSACQRLCSCSPIKKILNKIRDSCQTYINYYKTYAMTTCHGRIGDTSMNNSKHHDMDANNYQADINDLENIEHNHQAGLRDLTRKIEQLWQTIEANDNDPMDAISHLECKLNQLTITLHPPMPVEPIWEVLNKYTNTLCNTQKKMSLESSLL